MNINIIKTLAINDMYIANSGLYCFMIMIIITAVKAMPTIFIISIFLPFSYKLNIVLTVLNRELISCITIVRTITSPAKVVIMAWSSRPALTNT